ncbi:MAG: hypothetical protein Q9196_006697 [Gyalolechia fulgens]
METAASLITLIAFSLQSTKLVYQTIDDIRDGPSVITSLAESTKRLESILQQLLQLINHSGQSQQAHSPTTWKPLQQKISECSKDMQEASHKLDALNPNGAKHQVDRAWKRVKLSLKDSFFTRLDGQVKSHLAELGLQLQIVNTDVRQTQQHHTSETFFRTINNQLSLQSTSLHDHITEKAQGIEASLTTLVTGVDVADKNRVEESRQLRDSFEQINDTLTSRLNENEQSSRQLVQLSNEQIAAQFDQLHAISADQSQTILELLHQIRGCLKNESSAATPADKESNTKAQDTLDSVTSKDGGGALSAAIDRLCRYTSNTTTTYDSDEADDIIDDLEHIINALLDHDARNSGATHSERKRKRHADNGDPDVPREIKKIRGMLTASRAVEVYGSSLARMGRSNHGTRKGVRHSTEVYEMANCTAVVSIASGTYDKRMLISNTGTGLVRSTRDSYQGNISILPTHSTSATRISVSFTQRLTYSGFSSPHPRLSFHPIIPDNADIFTAVKNGNVDWMLELLGTGKASLHDCDCEGRSLLNYAIQGQQLTPCRFLIEHGADVDSMERCIDTTAYAAPLQQHLHMDFVMDEEYLGTSLAIRQLLLESGADPLAKFYRYAGSGDFFDDTLQSSPTDVIALFLKYGKELIDLKTRDENGQDYFLRMLLKFDSMWGRNLPQNIALLLSHGVDVGTKDLLGRSCLHTLLSNRHLAYYSYQQEPSDATYPFEMKVEAISLLIDMGADIYLVDDAGYSVTEWAHYLRQGEFWQTALKKAGWNVKQVYQKDHRNGRKVSDDPFAPQRDWRRQKRRFNCGSGRYFDLPDMELYKRLRFNHTRQIETESEKSDESSSDTEENAQEKDNDLKPELSLEVSNGNNTIDHPLDSDSDEEMGGVPITAAE